LCCSPIPSNSSLPIPSASTSTTPYGTPQPIDSDYRVKKDQEKEIDNQLMKLTKEKEKVKKKGLFYYSSFNSLCKYSFNLLILKFH
jgi:hypothetical protein